MHHRQKALPESAHALWVPQACFGFRGSRVKGREGLGV